MTIGEMKSLKVGDVCKDLEASGNFGIDVYCKVTKVEPDGIEIDCIDDEHCNAYPVKLLYRTCSLKLEKYSF